MSVLLVATTDWAATGRLIASSLGDVSLVQKAASQLDRRNVPLLPMLATVSDKHCSGKTWEQGYLQRESISDPTSFP